MDLKQIEKLMQAMVRSGLSRLALKEEGFEIELEREGRHTNMSAPSHTTHFYSPPPQQPVIEDLQSRKIETESKEGGYVVTSPMVGTYYSAPSPEDPQFIKVGDDIEEDTVICIIEAMKVMNEVKAGKRGKVKEIMLRNGDPVEFGTKIVRLV